MIDALVMLETRRLLRSPRARLVAFALFVLTLVASALGTLAAEATQAAAEADVASSQFRLRDRFSPPGAFTPVEAARWTDTVVARPTSAMAALTAGDLDALPAAATVRLGEAPRLVPSRVERSPAAALLGTFDVAWLLALVLPLAAIALGHDLFARDRSRGTLAMLLALSGAPTRLVLARAIALTVSLLAGLLPGLGLGIGMASTYLAGAPEVLDVLSVLGLATAATAAWSALVLAVSATSARVGEALVGALLGWTLLAVIVPLGVANLAALAYPTPSPRDQLEAEQAIASADPQVILRWIEAERARDPDLDPERAEDGVESTLRLELLTARATQRRASGARHATTRALARQAELLEVFAFASPSTITSAALAHLANTGPDARARFLADLRAYQEQLDLHVATPLRAHDTTPGQLAGWPRPKEAPSPDRAPALFGIAALSLIAAAGLAFAQARLARGPVAPDPEE